MHPARRVSLVFLGTCVDAKFLDSVSLHPSSSAVEVVEAVWAFVKRLQLVQTVLSPDWEDFVVEGVD
jgi:hypothetical protein